MSSSKALVSPRLTNCMSRTSSLSSSDLPSVPRSLRDIGHLDVNMGEVCQKSGEWPKSVLPHIRCHGFCCKGEALCACLVARGSLTGGAADELFAYSKRTQTDRRKSRGGSANFRG